MHHLIRCRLPILLHPSAFEHLCIVGLNHLIITIRTSSHFSLAYMLRRMDPTPYVIMPRSWRMWLEASLRSAGLKNLRCVSQNNHKFIPSQVCMPPNLNNCLLFIVMKLDQRVVQDLCIHDYRILMPCGLLPNRLVSRLTWFHSHILSNSQISYQVVFGNVSHITPMNLRSKLCTIPCAMYTF